MHGWVALRDAGLHHTPVDCARSSSAEALLRQSQGAACCLCAACCPCPVCDRWQVEAGEGAGGSSPPLRALHQNSSDVPQFQLRTSVPRFPRFSRTDGHGCSQLRYCLQRNGHKTLPASSTLNLVFVCSKGCEIPTEAVKMFSRWNCGLPCALYIKTWMWRLRHEPSGQPSGEGTFPRSATLAFWQRAARSVRCSLRTIRGRKGTERPASSVVTDPSPLVWRLGRTSALRTPE